MYTREEMFHEFQVCETRYDVLVFGFSIISKIHNIARQIKKDFIENKITSTMALKKIHDEIINPINFMVEGLSYKI